MAAELPSGRQHTIALGDQQAVIVGVCGAVPSPTRPGSCAQPASSP